MQQNFCTTGKLVMQVWTFCLAVFRHLWPALSVSLPFFTDYPLFTSLIQNSQKTQTNSKPPLLSSCSRYFWKLASNMGNKHQLSRQYVTIYCNSENNAWNAYQSPQGRRCHRHSSDLWCNYGGSLGTAQFPLNLWSDLRRELLEKEGKQQKRTVNKYEATSLLHWGKWSNKIQSTNFNWRKCTGKQFISQNEMKSHLWTFLLNRQEI